MRPRYLAIFIATFLAIALFTSTTYAISPKAQAAKSIVAQVLQVPASDLQVVSEVNVDDNLTRTKVLHPKTRRISGINLDQNNRQVPAEQVQAILASKQAKDFKGKLEAELADKVSRSQPTATTSVRSEERFS